MDTPKLVDMTLTATERKAMTEPSAVSGALRYPYGLSLNLEEAVLAKLGLTTLPKVGEPLMLHALVNVTSVRSDETQDGANRSIGLQITEMGLGPAPAKEEAKASAEEKLYQGA